ncbi:hypothetical protein KUCAC02_018768 [Chaenocephalus aceratus]|uniref:Uncharacterized protein n=1 Tax=Chaenocephalus aceratus TaxID=36190 RepID=A0ACB9WAD7_CHAAC|nr:hypothetical protein KUCAC02_018768 [Chaenocephalus aceratus]
MTFFYNCQALVLFTFAFLFAQLFYSIRNVDHTFVESDQVCCAQGNDTTAVTCCKQFVDNTYYNIAMVTRKLSGVLIMLLLFAVGYFVQRMLCFQIQAAHPATPPRTSLLYHIARSR